MLPLHRMLAHPGILAVLCVLLYLLGKVTGDASDYYLIFVFIALIIAKAVIEIVKASREHSRKQKEEEARFALIRKERAEVAAMNAAAWEEEKRERQALAQQKLSAMMNSDG